jgi:ABC-type glutathione transport system ATPase component
MTNAPLLDVRSLRVTFGNGRGAREVVHGVSFSVSPGETLAIVGESGSGKSVTALSVIGLLPKEGAYASGIIRFDGRDLLALSSDELRRLRGERIAMVFQEPMTSLNPVLTIGRQMTESLVAHGHASEAEARQRAVTMLERVGIRDTPRRLRQYPHELSGGMRQRVMIGMAMLMQPALLIADEPTTALDVTIQAQILDLMRKLIAETGTSLILITHDMGVVAEEADRVIVMRNGHVVEEADTVTLFSTPRRAYTAALLAAVPRIVGDSACVQSEQPAASPVAEAEHVTKAFDLSSGFFGRRRTTRALDDVSLAVRSGEALGLVGESGSGKSTLGRAIARLTDIDQGKIRIEGEDVLALTGRPLRRVRAKVQLIFQDPYASLDPRFTIGRTVAEPIIIRGEVPRREAMERAAELLERVALDPSMISRYPHEFSGGQRQRVAIARALAAEPKIIIADEPTSALDVSIQAGIIELLGQLRDTQGISLLFISHDLAVVRRVASRVAVMRSGRVLEIGPTNVVLKAPGHIYTKALLSSAPVPDPARRGRIRITAPEDAYPAGPLVEVSPGHWVAA